MAQVVWNAGTILQITQTSDAHQGGTQCVGKTKSNTRCGWRIRNQYTEISSLLQTISRTRPDFVTRETLYRLARLCLCPDWHWNQQDGVVARWTGLVNAEAQSQNANGGNPPTPLYQSDPQLQASLRETQQRLLVSETLIQGVRRELETERLSLQQTRQSAAATETKLRLDLVDWKNRLERSEDDRKTQKVVISQLQESNNNLKLEAKKELAGRKAGEQEIVKIRQELEQIRQNAAAKESKLLLDLTNWKSRLDRIADDTKVQEIDISQLQNSNEALTMEARRELTARVAGEKEIIAIKEELETERAMMSQFRQSATTTENELNLQISNWKAQVRNSEESKRARDVMVSQMQESNNKLKIEVQKELNGREKSEKEVITLQRSVEETSAQLQASRKEGSEARRDNQMLSSELFKIRNDQADSAEVLKKMHAQVTISTELNQELTTKLEAKEDVLRQSDAELKRERARIADLENQIAKLEASKKSIEEERAQIAGLQSKIDKLEISERDLKASISSCWWHGTLMRLAASRKRLSSKGEKAASLSTVPHASRTNVLYK